jgi:hypothetical protein
METARATATSPGGAAPGLSGTAFELRFKTS